MQPWHATAGARLFDLGQPMRTGMPQSPNHPPFRMVLDRRHGDVVRPNGGSAANELIITGGHVGTHVDALAHVSQDGLLHGGVAAASVQSNHGFSALGVDAFPPYVGRCVLLDVAGVHGCGALPPGYEVTAEDLDLAEKAAGLTVGTGEAVLIGTGWSRHWSDGPLFTGQVDGAPGPGTGAARWLVDRRVRLAGAESIAFECIPPGRGHAELPVHRMLLVEAGINIVETLRLDELLDSGVREFLLMLSPLPIVGATGSPVRPLALAVS
jgi:kynurenine formamidase